MAESCNIVVAFCNILSFKNNMDSTIIINKLKATPYKYTYVTKLKDELKEDPDGDAEEILEQLRLSLTKPENAEIAKPLEQVIGYFRMNKR